MHHCPASTSSARPRTPSPVSALLCLQHHCCISLVLGPVAAASTQVQGRHRRRAHLCGGGPARLLRAGGGGPEDGQPARRGGHHVCRPRKGQYQHPVSHIALFWPFASFGHLLPFGHWGKQANASAAPFWCVPHGAVQYRVPWHLPVACIQPQPALTGAPSWGPHPFCMCAAPLPRAAPSSTSPR